MRRSRQDAEPDHHHHPQNRTEDNDEDETDDIPLHHKRAFGAGLKRQRVEFVRAQDLDAGIQPQPLNPVASSSIGDIYASIVLGSKKGDDTDTKSKEDTVQICDICSLPITTSITDHEASLAHQVSVSHSHPPSALDRSRMGLRTLTSKGWDPDARIGLGRGGEGMRYPIKIAAKEDTLGIGAAEAAKARQEEAAKKKQAVVEAPVKVLTGKEMQILAEKEKKKAVKLQAEIFGRADIDKYLKRGPEWE